jgi:creatinine amidohydrolase/Fe(II)-dependent formamide hydrolase-like protein
MRCCVSFAILLSGCLSAWQKPAPVEIERMTYTEIDAAIHRQGKTTVLIYNGGTEQRGPQAVLGGHTIMAQRTAAEIARRLGNALVAPVLPFSPAAGHLKPQWPGTVDLPADVYVKVNEAVVASMVTNGFRDIVLMGDHGGGQKDLEELAGRLNARYAPRGVRVYFCGAVYKKASDEFNAWLKEHHYPLSTHAGIPDTSLLMYLGGDDYVRKDKLAAGDGKNGISGDARPSTPELGRRYFEIKVSAGVEEIRRLVAQARAK